MLKISKTTKSSEDTKTNPPDDYYNTLASGYNELYGEEQQAKLSLVCKLIENDADFQFKLSSILFDVGCGTGISTSFLPITCAGLDPARELLNIASSSRQCTISSINERKSRHLGYIQGMAEALPIKSKVCNIAISITVVHNFNDILRGITELWRITKDRAIVSVLKKTKRFDEIVRIISTKFEIIKTAEDAMDFIYYLKPKN
jgi:ubiquinone/menaquinone biosynthesis C-methylase UbiE